MKHTSKFSPAARLESLFTIIFYRNSQRLGWGSSEERKKWKQNSVLDGWVRPKGEKKSGVYLLSEKILHGEKVKKKH